MNNHTPLDELWQSLLANALLGTGRQAPPAIAAVDSLTTLLGQIAASEAEARLLSQSALVSIVRKAGQKAAERQSTLPTAAEQDLPVASVTANRLLANMLAGSHNELLSEWLSLAARHNQRVADEHLPALLDLGGNRSALVNPIRAVIGRRGEWLATLNPGWNYALGLSEDLQETWEGGVGEQRIQAFRKLRQQNPAEARQLLAKSWASEPPPLRAKLLAHFADGLSLQDEEFLEAGLDDRRKEVREEAAALLARLPQAQLSQRMTQRVAPLLKVTGLLRKSIDVTLPSECSAAMQRDGIQEKLPPHAIKMGERAWWLSQMLALIPTQFWLRHFNQSAQRLIDYAERSEWRDLLLDGWLSAATLHQEEEMAAALAEHFYGSNPAQLMRSLDALPSAYIEEKLKAALSQRNFILNNQEPATLLLFNYRRPWSDDLSRLFVAAMQRTLQQPFVYPSFAWVSGQLAQIAQQISPVIGNEKNFDLRTEREDWAHMARYLDEFVALVHFRHDLKQAFAQS